MSKQLVTLVVIGVICIFLVVYDAFALFAWGSEATISCVINIYAFNAHPLMVFIFGMLVGGLIVHFFEWKPIVKLKKPRKN